MLGPAVNSGRIHVVTFPILPIALFYSGIAAAIGAGLGALGDYYEKRVVVLYQAPEISE